MCPAPEIAPPVSPPTTAFLPAFASISPAERSSPRISFCPISLISDEAEFPKPCERVSCPMRFKNGSGPEERPGRTFEATMSAPVPRAACPRRRAVEISCPVSSSRISACILLCAKLLKAALASDAVPATTPIGAAPIAVPAIRGASVMTFPIISPNVPMPLVGRNDFSSSIASCIV